MQTTACVQQTTKPLPAAAARPCGLVVASAILAGSTMTAAMQSAAAQARGQSSLFGLRAESIEVLETEAAIASERLFQRIVQLECDQNFCSASLPPVKRKQRLVIQFVSCRAFTTVANDISTFLAEVEDGSTTVFSHVLGPIFETNGGTLAQVSQPIVLTVTDDLSLGLTAFSRTGRLSSADCRVSGVSQTLN